MIKRQNNLKKKEKKLTGKLGRKRRPAEKGRGRGEGLIWGGKRKVKKNSFFLLCIITRVKWLYR